MNRLPPTRSPAAHDGAAPAHRVRALAVLAALVLAAHALLLSNAAAWFGAAHTPELADAPAKAFATRRIASPPPLPTTPSMPSTASGSPPQAQAAPRIAKKPIFKPKQPLAQAVNASAATDSIANDLPAPAAETAEASPVVDAAATPAVVASAPVEASAPPPSQATSAPAAPAAAALPVTTPVTSVVLPASAILSYQMTGNAKGLTYHADAEMGWRNLGDHYYARMTVSALFLGSRSMASVGQLGAGGLAPTRFSDKSRSEVAAHFEPDKGLITFSANTPSAPWVPGAQDRVSVFFQISGLIASRPADFPLGTMVVMYTAGPRSADTWAFTVAAEELLTLPYGDVKTIKLQRKPQRDYDQTVEIWLAPALNYLPVRSKITQSNGDFIDQQLKALTRP